MKITERQLDLWERWLPLENAASYHLDKGWTPRINWDTSLNNRFAGNSVGDGRPADQPWLVAYYSRYDRIARRMAVIDYDSLLDKGEDRSSIETERLADYTRQLGKAANNLHIMGYVNEAIILSVPIEEWQAAQQIHVARTRELLVDFDLDTIEATADEWFFGFDVKSVGFEQAMVDGMAEEAFLAIEGEFPKRDIDGYNRVADPINILTHAFFIRQSERYGWPKPGVLSQNFAEFWDEAIT